MLVELNQTGAVRIVEITLDKTDPLAERLYAFLRQRPVNCSMSDAEDVAAEVRAFLAERVTMKKARQEAGVCSVSCLHDRCRGAGEAINAVLALLRREVGG